MKPGTIIRTLLALAILAAVPCFASTDDLSTYDLSASGLNYSRFCRQSANATVAQLNRMTESEQDQFEMCASYTAGVLDGLMQAQADAKASGYVLYGIPRNINGTQATLITCTTSTGIPKTCTGQQSTS